MKLSTSFIILVLLCNMLAGFAQSPTASNENVLLGSWIRETASERELKIITPTHFIFVIEDMKTDTFKFVGIGTYQLAGDLYKETIQFSNITNAALANPVYEFKVVGETFYQKGTLVLAGNKNPLSHTFKKAKTSNNYPNNSSIGTWSWIGAATTVKKSPSGVADSSVYIITPTHWMEIDFKDTKRLVTVMGGTYTLDGNKSTLKVEHGIANKGQTLGFIQRVEGEKLYRVPIVKGADGKVLQTEEVFQSVHGR